MITIEDFDRLYDNFFGFNYALKDVTYRSGVFFKEKCSNEYFTQVFFSIQENLSWLEQNIDNIKLGIQEKLPIDADIIVFKNLYIISFSLFFEEKCDIPNIQLAYGNEVGETYIIAVMREKQIISVELN